MSGKILIVDSVATNRIVLNVKLSAAFYTVFQAASAREALDLAKDHRPDMVVCAASLPDMGFALFARRLRALPDLQALPLVALLDRNAPETRLAILGDGATDIVAKPFSEPVFLARLRSLLRQTHRDSELGIRADAAEALGLSEAPAPFFMPGRVAVVDANRARAEASKVALSQVSGHQIDSVVQQPGHSAIEPIDAPDVILLRIGGTGEDGGLALLAELRSSAATRDACLIAQLDSTEMPLAATVLDMGASDVVSETTDPREIAMRLSAQIRCKRNKDIWRSQVQNGLQAALTDPLTGLYNRRYALSFLKRQLGAIDEAAAPFAVMVADLDHFKAVNDTYGHAVGDVVLTRIAGQLRGGVGADGMVARLGGEEFLIVLPDSSRAAARQAADRLCRLIRETPFNVPDRADPVHVTISIGVTLARPGPDVSDPAVEALINQADRALYGAKADGRNTVTFSARSAA
jgi:two-component system cell cycle response regulator